MQWQQVRANYPNQWLIVEALDAHTDNAQRHLEQLAVIESCQDSKMAFNHYHEWHKNYPEREFYFLHTSKEQLAIVERQWLRIRKNVATRDNLLFTRIELAYQNKKFYYSKINGVV